MAKHIIGIHGLANKPPKATLADGWQRSILEGLAKNRGLTQATIPFGLAYWADLLYKYPRHDDSGMPFDDLFDNAPYIEAQAGALKRYEETWLDELRRLAGQVGGEKVDKLAQMHDFDPLTDAVITLKFRDLDYYYDPKRNIRNRQGEMRPAREVIQGELLQALLANKDSEIAIIAHSMGSIVAYEVLSTLHRHPAGPFRIPYFITIGSPLGLTNVKWEALNYLRQQGLAADDRLRTPEVVSQVWVNFADRRDAVAIDPHLADDYRANSAGLQVKDDLISNDYVDLDGEHDYHKIYGYLRTPEMSDVLATFLDLS